MTNANKKKEESCLITDEFLEWHTEQIDPTLRKCLVIMPIGKKGSVEYINNIKVFAKIIKPCVENSGFNFNCYHADLIDESGNIQQQIFEGLRDDDLVIADFRRNNVNMIYELGIRHTFGKRAILVCSDLSENIFYSTTYRSNMYKTDGSSNNEFFDKMKNQIKEAVENPDKSDNPVTDLIGKGHLVSSCEIAPEKKVVFNEDINAFEDSEGGRYCSGCYDDKRKLIRINQKGNYHYSCPICGTEYLDKIKEKNHRDKRARMQLESLKRVNQRKYY